MKKLTLEQANTIISAAIAKGAELGFKPLAVAVLDAGGNLKAYGAQDGSTPYRFEIAAGKARASILTGASSRALHNQAGERPHFLAALGSSIPGGMVPVPGGVAVLDAAGTVVGAVGVTGDTSDNDEKCAVAGIEAAGLKPGV
jgi:uncharacterized protein GlcG (DUF336 family)